MTMPLPRKALAGAALALGLAAAFTSAPATAQGFTWLWGGGNEYGGSGREVVRFGMQHRPGQIIVSFGDRRLYYVTRPGEAISYPIATPRDQSRWQGTMHVSNKMVNPPWTPTPTMRREDPKLPAHVPGGHPLNPMGVRALYLGSSMYRIHGTDAPWTIGQAVSKGCVRMYNKDVVDLYDRVRLGARVTVTWQRFQSGPAVASSAPSSSGYGSSAPSFSSVFGLSWMGSDDEARPRAAAAPSRYSALRKKRIVRRAVTKQPARKAAAAPQRSVAAQ